MTTREMTAAEHARTARDFLAASDREFADDDPFIVAGFATAERFRANFFRDNMEDYDVA